MKTKEIRLLLPSTSTFSLYFGCLYVDIFLLFFASMLNIIDIWKYRCNFSVPNKTRNQRKNEGGKGYGRTEFKDENTKGKDISIANHR